MIARIKFALRVVFRAIIVFSLCIMPMSASQAQSGSSLIQKPRLALVIGNSNYANLPILKNPGQDAALVASTLRDLGFEVVERSDLTKKSFQAAIREVAKKASDHEAVLFYYAGHGFQLDGRNFLVPVDARLNNRKRIGDEALVLDDIIGELHDDGRQTLFFLDACRNNPIPVSAKGEKLSEGLAQVETGRGTFVAFATQPGNITNDGAGEHSPFSLALAEHMETGGISISDMMIRVRNSVEEQTLEKQTPWDQSSLRSQFYFKPLIEDSETLTEDDLGLLTQLDPALLEKFQKRFGLELPETGEEASLPVIANVRPTLLIEEADPAEEADTDLPVDKPVDVAKLEEEPQASLARSTSEPDAIEPGLLILDGGEEEETATEAASIGESATALALAKLPKIAVPAEKPESSSSADNALGKQNQPALQTPKVIAPAPQVIAAAQPTKQQPVPPANAPKAALPVLTQKTPVTDAKDEGKPLVTGVQVPLVTKIPAKPADTTTTLAMADNKPFAALPKQIIPQVPAVSKTIQESSKLDRVPVLPDPAKKSAYLTLGSDKSAPADEDPAGNIQLTALAKPEAPKFIARDTPETASPLTETIRLVPALPEQKERKEIVVLTAPSIVTAPAQTARPLVKVPQPAIVPVPVKAPPLLSTEPEKKTVIALAKPEAIKPDTAKVKPSLPKPAAEAKPTDRDDNTTSGQIDTATKEAGKPLLNAAQPKNLPSLTKVSPPPAANPDGVTTAPPAKIVSLEKPVQATKPIDQAVKPTSGDVSLAPKLTPTSNLPIASATKVPPAPLAPKSGVSTSTAAGNLEGEKSKTGAEVLMAALDPSQPPVNVFETPKVLEPVIPETAIEDQKPSEAKQKEFAIKAQKELQRLGCYRSVLDGNWSARSARALLRYYAERKINPDEVEPSQKLIDLLSAEQTVVCKTTKVEKPKQSVQKPDRSKAKAVAPQKNNSVKAQPAPSAAKPKSTPSRPVQPAVKKPKPVETTKSAPTKPPVKKPGAAPIVGLFR